MTTYTKEVPLDERSLPWNIDNRPESRQRMESSARRLLAMGKSVDEVYRMYGVPRDRLEELAKDAPVVNRSAPPEPGYVLPAAPATATTIRPAPQPPRPTPVTAGPTPVNPAVAALERAKTHERAGIRTAAVRAEKALGHVVHLLAEADKAERDKAKRQEEQRKARERQQRERAEAERKLAELEEQLRATKEQLSKLRKGTGTRLTKRRMSEAQLEAARRNAAKAREAKAAKRSATP